MGAGTGYHIAQHLLSKNDLKDLVNGLIIFFLYLLQQEHTECVHGIPSFPFQQVVKATASSKSFLPSFPTASSLKTWDGLSSSSQCMKQYPPK